MKNTNPTVTILQCVCVYMSCLRPRTNTPTCQRALDWEPADGALNANHTVYVCTSVCYVCTCECAHLSTIRLMFINTFCCVEWNCSEPWHRTACFSGLDVHARECVSWHGLVIQSCQSSADDYQLLSDWWQFKALASYRGTRTSKNTEKHTIKQGRF